MEIFLLLIVIILIVIFYTNQNTKLLILQTKLSKLEDYLKNLKLNSEQQSITKKTEVVEKWESSMPPTKQNQIITEPVIITPVIPSMIPPIIKEVIFDDKTINDKISEIKIAETPIQEAFQQTIQQPIQQAKKPIVPQESWYDKFRKNNPDLEKFIGENLVSKIGIAILVIGIAFFVKFAIDKEWINEIARVGIGVLCGVILLGFAHRLSERYKAFSSVLVAGGISIFYFTIGIAFH